MKKVQSKPKDISVVYLQAVLMPNGEVISVGKTLGQFKDFKGFLFELKKEN